MTDPEPTDTGPEPSGEESGGTGGGPSGPGSDADSRAPADPTTYLTYGGLAVLSLLAAVATFRFYVSASRAVGIWIAPEFEPLIQAAFNLAVVLSAGLGLSLLVRQLQ